MGRKVLTKKNAWPSLEPDEKLPASPADQLYTLEVALVSGPVPRTFVRKNRAVARTIQVLGSHTLDDLHNAIFQAFDRWDEHLYEFQFGRKPHDPAGDRFGPPGPRGASFFEAGVPAGDASRTKIASLRLEVGRAFGYWFDFGDDWYHQVNVLAIGRVATKIGQYPRVAASKGASPPQYPDAEDEQDA